MALEVLVVFSQTGIRIIFSFHENCQNHYQSLELASMRIIRIISDNSHDLSYRLTEDPDSQVLLMEAGPK